jgi:hypothetical protein
MGYFSPFAEGDSQKSRQNGNNYQYILLLILYDKILEIFKSTFGFTCG